jgi:hypothetical protein
MYGLRQLGTIEPGKLADVVILDRDPLQDIHNTQAIRAVIKDGIVVDRTYSPAHGLPLAHPGPITKHLYNPLPRIADVVPPTGVEGDGVALRITGRGFVGASVVTADDRALPTTWVSATELRVAVPAALMRRVGTLSLSVRNPRPGGGDSNVVVFLVAPR